MADSEDAVKFLEQFGGSEAPSYVEGSSVFGKGDRVTDAYGVPLSSLYDKPASDGALGQVGGARRRLSRKTRKTRKTRNRKTRNRKTHSGGSRRSRFTLNLRAQIRLKH
jgi:hypothetical protein